MTRKKKQAEDTSSAVNENKDFQGLSDEIYLNNVDVEDQLTNCMESLLKFKPDKPLNFMHSFFQLSKTKEYPYSLPVVYRIKSIITFTVANPFYSKNLVKAYKILQDYDQITAEPLIEVGDLLLSAFSSKHFFNYILPVTHFNEPLDAKIWLYITDNLLRYVDFITKMEEIHRTILKYYQLHSQVKIVAENYFSLPKLVVDKIIRQRFCLRVV